MALTRTRHPTWIRLPALWIGMVSGLVAATEVHAEVHKCQDANGRIHYSDQPCRGQQARVYRPPDLTTIESDKLTGGRRDAAVPETGLRKWLPKAPDPVAECRARGGEIDLELRACRLP